MRIFWENSKAMNKAELLTAIDATIATNGKKAISAQSLKNILNEMVNATPEGGSGQSCNDDIVRVYVSDYFDFYDLIDANIPLDELIREDPLAALMLQTNAEAYTKIIEAYNEEENKFKLPTVVLDYSLIDSGFQIGRTMPASVTVRGNAENGYKVYLNPDSTSYLRYTQGFYLGDHPASGYRLESNGLFTYEDFSLLYVRATEDVELPERVIEHNAIAIGTAPLSIIKIVEVTRGLLNDMAEAGYPSEYLLLGWGIMAAEYAGLIKQCVCCVLWSKFLFFSEEGLCYATHFNNDGYLKRLYETT